MSTNHTPNYALSQWEKSDKVLMEDFNADNAKIDAALKTEADARAAGDAALTAALNKKGNCRVYTAAYVGDGVNDSPTATRHTFPAKPLLVIITHLGGESVLLAPADATSCSYFRGASIYGTKISWSGNTLSWQTANNAYNVFNHEGYNYRIMALICAD